MGLQPLCMTTLFTVYFPEASLNRIESTTSSVCNYPHQSNHTKLFPFKEAGEKRETSDFSRKHDCQKELQKCKLKADQPHPRDYPYIFSTKESILL